MQLWLWQQDRNILPKKYFFMQIIQFKECTLYSKSMVYVGYLTFTTPKGSYRLQFWNLPMLWMKVIKVVALLPPLSIVCLCLMVSRAFCKVSAILRVTSIFLVMTDINVFLFFFFCLFRATPEAYGGSQARGRIGSVAAGLPQSYSNTRSEHLRPTWQLKSMLDI